MATSLVFFIIADFKQLLNFITKYVYTQKQVYMEKNRFKLVASGTSYEILIIFVAALA